jgi:hypothetical protein
MRESHVEGVANHDDPEPCIGAREGAGEAWDRGTYGLGIEPRNALLRGADAVIRGGRQHDRRRHRETPVNPARSKTPCTYGTSLRENRENSGTPTAMVRWAASGRRHAP